MRTHDRPEHIAPPEIFYNEDEARKYTSNSRMIAIQEKLTKRALELLALPSDGSPKLLLDIGCGSGLSGETISEAGHLWFGLDISPAMLDVALDREVAGDLCLSDIGHGLPVKRGAFDGAVSISAVQWLCNADKTCNDPRRRLRRFFETLYSCLARGARAVLQVYPESAVQAEMITAAAMRAGFTGGLVVDFPHSTRAKKYYLVLMVGSAATLPQAKGLDGGSDDDEEGEGVKVVGRRKDKRKRGDQGDESSKDWIVRKKDQMRRRGYENIPTSNKYTGRKRGPKF